MKQLCVVTSLATLACLAPAQWQDLRKLGQGGETNVASDGAGTVYATSHLPTQIFVSRDWGQTFSEPHMFENALGDMIVAVREKGEATVCYMPPTINGMVTHTTSDYGKSWIPGQGITGRKLDREWMVYDRTTKMMYMNYSDGYIGGPKSKGVFLSESQDGGATWTTVGRIDKEPDGSYAIDPHLAIATDGRLYAYWTVSTDYNTIDEYKFSTSSDSGKTWDEPVLIAKVNKDGNDTQERWMLGGIAAFGKGDVLAFFVNYREVDGKSALVCEYRTSRDAGKSWSLSAPVCPENELESASMLFNKRKLQDANYPWFAQCLVWACFDAKGRPHFVWQDNRDGQGMVGTNAVGRWQVRHATAPELGKNFEPSERVSASVACKRPPLDFLCAAADSKFLYVTYTQNPSSVNDWDFTGEFWFGRKPLQ